MSVIFNNYQFNYKGGPVREGENDHGKKTAPFARRDTTPATILKTRKGWARRIFP